MYNLDGPNMDPSQIINIASTDRQILVSCTSEPDFEALDFPKGFSTERFYFSLKRDKPITMLKYIHS